MRLAATRVTGTMVAAGSVESQWVFEVVSYRGVVGTLVTSAI